MNTDRLEMRLHEQLSLLMDGELHADEARFLLRRLQHDGELGARWERWHIAGEALRGRVTAPATAGFSARVATAIAEEKNTLASPSHMNLLRWGGGALAASLAAVSVFVAWPQHQADAPATAQVAQAPTTNASTVQPVVAVPVTAPVAVVKESLARPSRAIAQVAASGAARPHRAPEFIAPVESAKVPADAAIAEQPENKVDPFAPSDVRVASKPWPHSILQPSNNAFNASFDSIDLNESHPFAPQVPLQVPPAEPQR